MKTRAFLTTSLLIMLLLVVSIPAAAENRFSLGVTYYEDLKVLTYSGELDLLINLSVEGDFNIPITDDYKITMAGLKWYIFDFKNAKIGPTGGLTYLIHGNESVSYPYIGAFAFIRLSDTVELNGSVKTFSQGSPDENCTVLSIEPRFNLDDNLFIYWRTSTFTYENNAGDGGPVSDPARISVGVGVLF